MKKEKKEIKYYEAIGRRKEATARVRLYIVTNKNEEIKLNDLEIKKGQIYINFQPLEKFFTHQDQQLRILYPLTITDQKERFAISVLVKGGGKEGQLGAIVHGISRALVSVDESFKEILRRNGLLMRDSREKERRKVGTGGKARRKKQSPKR